MWIMEHTCSPSQLGATARCYRYHCRPTWIHTSNARTCPCSACLTVRLVHFHSDPVCWCVRSVTVLCRPRPHLILLFTYFLFWGCHVVSLWNTPINEVETNVVSDARNESPDVLESIPAPVTMGIGEPVTMGISRIPRQQETLNHLESIVEIPITMGAMKENFWDWNGRPNCNELWPNLLYNFSTRKKEDIIFSVSVELPRFTLW